MKTGLTVLILVTLAACGTSPSKSAQPMPVSQAQLPNVAGFTQTLNEFRASQGRGAMRQNALLTQAANAHAADMERRGYFSHSSVGGPNGDDLVARAQSAGCTLRAGAENIAQGQRSEQDVFTAWRNSPGHRRNLLGAPYTEYGLGRVGDTWVMKLSSGC